MKAVLLSLLACFAVAGCSAEAADVAAVDDAELTEPASCTTCELVVGASIRGITPEMSAEEVKQVLGRPGRVRTDEVYLVYVYGRTEIWMDGSVTWVSTASALVRTADGIGVGTTQAALEDAYPTLSCQSGDDYCTLDGERTTLFEIFGGKVTRVTVSI